MSGAKESTSSSKDPVDPCERKESERDGALKRARCRELADLADPVLLGALLRGENPSSLPPELLQLSN
jgi:hypothetical protein